jgi:hypothetical protein
MSIGTVSIIDAIKDENLFRPFLADREGSIHSWRSWLAALRVMYGFPVKGKERRSLVERCTGRSVESFNGDGYDQGLYLTGRRSGKSRIAAIIGAYEAVLAGHETKLSPGEKGVVAVCAPTKRQGRIVRDYLRSIFTVPMLQSEVITETREGFELRNGNRIEILAGDWRTIRGYTLLAAIVDEIAFFGLDDESKVRNDTELLRAIRPSLATVGGRLCMISSPYARRGATFKMYQKNFGNDAGRALVWNAPSRVMNETLPQRVIDEAMAEDLQAAKSEYLGEFRDDIAAFISREVVEQLVAEGRYELSPVPGTRYHAFCDVSGGRSDDAALAIAHKQGRKVIVDFVRRYRPPHNPYECCADMCRELRRFGLSFVHGDNFGADWVAQAFKACGIRYRRAEKPKSQLYAELLPRLCSGEIELLDDDVAITQLAGLERRTRSGGRDIIDHPPGNQHDDVANVIAGVTEVCASRVSIGAV